MNYDRDAEWQELTDAVTAAIDSGNEFYARRIMQRVRRQELSKSSAIHLLQSDALRVRNYRIRTLA